MFEQFQEQLYTDLQGLMGQDSPVGIYPHIHADGDALGSCLALAEAVEQVFGLRVTVWLEEALESKLAACLQRQDLLQLAANGSYESGKVAVAPSAEAYALMLDCHEPSRLGRRQTSFLAAAGRAILDHHEGTAEGAGLHHVEAAAAATAELVTELIQSWERRHPGLLKPSMANNLMVGLLTDTGKFAYSSVRARTFAAAAYLMGQQPPLYSLAVKLFDERSPARLRLEGEIKSQAEFLFDGRVLLAFLDLELSQRLGLAEGDTEGLAAELRSVEGVELALLLRETEQHKWRASVRTEESLDANLFAARFGGGGHRRAAGFRLPAMRRNRARAKCLQELGAFLTGQGEAEPESQGAQAGLRAGSLELEEQEPRTGRTAPPPPQGILPVYKPAGPTSFAAVARARKGLGLRRIGHCGTLDPFAEGLLVLAVGRACSLLPFMEDYDKRYRFELCLGRSTETLDTEGAVTEERLLTAEDQAQLEALFADPERRQALLGQYLGPQDQIPPSYSAIKVGGRALYSYARSGGDMPPIEARRVLCHSLEFLGLRTEPQERAGALVYLSFELHCGKGYYVRSLARDLAAQLGYPGHCSYLQRRAVGPYQLEQAVDFEKLAEPGLAQALLPLRSALPGRPVIEFTPAEIDALLCGRQPLIASERIPEGRGPYGVVRDPAAELLGFVRLGSRNGRGEVRAIVERMFCDRESLQHKEN